MIGYARGMTGVDTSTQKYTCHKVNEYVVGSSSKVNGDLSNISVGLLQAMLDVKQPITKEVRGRVNFFSEILKAQAESNQDLEYWLDYVFTFGVEHKIPAYDGMTIYEYLNAEVWGPIGGIFLILFFISVFILKTCLRCCFGSDKSASDSGKISNAEKEKVQEKASVAKEKKDSVPERTTKNQQAQKSKGKQSKGNKNKKKSE